MSDPQDLSELMQAMRPRLHRYCARMVGSAIDGEDVVQEALVKATLALRDGASVDQPQAWLLKIAHNSALDALRRRARQADEGELPDDLADKGASADARVAAHASLASFLGLAPLPRGAVILVDVLGHSAEEAQAVLGCTLPALKAALHRGRARLRDLASVEAPRRLEASERARLQAYADRFNARDFDALRALLAEDVQLDLVSRLRLKGKAEVGQYFTRYAAADPWRLRVGLADGRAALLFSNPKDPAGAVHHVALLEWSEGTIVAIRDFLYGTYVLELMVLEVDG